jgi:hypothetical protein
MRTLALGYNGPWPASRTPARASTEPSFQIARFISHTHAGAECKLRGVYAADAMPRFYFDVPDKLGPVGIWGDIDEGSYQAQERLAFRAMRAVA